MSDTMLRYNTGKPPLGLVPNAFTRALMYGGTYRSAPRALKRDVAQVLGFGAKKYTPNNWRKGGNWTDVYSCAMRHLDYYLDGETHDPESGLHHLAHMGCNLAFLLEFAEQETNTDDRFNNKPVVPLTKQDYELDTVAMLMLAWLETTDPDSVGMLRTAVVVLAAYYEKITPVPPAQIPDHMTIDYGDADANASLPH